MKTHFVRVVPCLTVLVASLSQRRLAFNARQPHERFAAKKCHRDSCFCKYFDFPPSVLFHQLPMLIHVS